MFLAKSGDNVLDSFDIVPELQIQLFNSFLQGKTLQTIQEQAPAISLGQLVNTALTLDWHGQREEYLQDLYYKAKDSLARTILQGIDFLTTALGVVHQVMGEKYAQYLITKDTTVLEEFGIKNFHQYSNVLDTLMVYAGENSLLKPMEKAKQADPPKEEETEKPPTANLLKKLSEQKKVELEELRRTQALKKGAENG